MEKLNGGWIELIIGPMFSGKTEELMMRLRRALIAKQQVLVFKPIIDNRYSVNSVTSHNQLQFEATPIATAGQILEQIASLKSKIDIIGIDEAQFFSDDLIGVCETLANQGYRVIVSGLDSDYRKEPFGPIPRLAVIAEFVIKKQAICFNCGELASFTKRISGGQEQVEVGGTEKYQASCRRCFNLEIPH